MRYITLPLTTALAAAWLLAAPPAELEYPKIKNHGGVFRIAGEPELPQSGSKVVIDVSSGEQDGGVND
jgi:hypothetical protein